MHLPDDFGLSPIQTLAHVADTTPAPAHSVFWNAWQAEVLESPAPALLPRRPADSDPSDPSASHQFEGFRHARIGAALFLPPTPAPVRAALIALHGYTDIPRLSAEEDRWRDLVNKGVAVLCIRVRGFPGSQLDAPGAAQNPLGWITHGLDAPISNPSQATNAALSWVLPQAVGDVALACRAIARRFGQLTPLYVFGGSFGAALAVIAAAQLDPVKGLARLALALPSLGDWPWRLAHRAGGAALQIEQFLTLHGARRERMVDLLRLLDTAVHAPMIRCPTLCKLAERDDVVPAPSCAAVFNAIASDPGLKWRFVVPYGHFDGGIRNARRHAAFDAALNTFFDPAWNPTRDPAVWETPPLSVP